MKLLLHAPTVASLRRARRNAANALRSDPNLEVRIIINADAVAAALDEPDPDLDRLLIFCGNTLDRLGKHPSPNWVTVPAAIVAIAEWQQEGWIYIRA